jgi:RNA polymerase sigma factor (sigma-70 family)
MKRKAFKNKARSMEQVHDNAEVSSSLDYIEISMSHENLEKIAQKQALLLEQRQDYAKRRHIVRKQEKLLKKIFKAASQVLTDAQFQIFSMRYIYQMPEAEIAQQVGCVQNYVSRVLRASIKKIQKRLRVPINLKGFSKDRKDK